MRRCSIVNGNRLCNRSVMRAAKIRACLLSPIPSPPATARSLRSGPTSSVRSDPARVKGWAEKLELFDGWALDSETAADERPPELASEALKGEKSWTRRRKRTLLR
ncbi:hypothetical protein BQ8482_111143 [Mesorhizobium delmotii]|uniref:Uncharacterized protein n=1 Tax=Mesorhizobium delmotii TaxID=1631247 RepID=A0A2P9ADK3_9HYPH|nr:hypothetical protein BQ8482_111143 [Mesorhizobium delmotii]